MSNQQTNTERLSFKIGLSGTFWYKRPEYSILINGINFAQGNIQQDSGTVEYIEFDTILTEDCEHILEINLLNKENSDVIKDPPVGDPYKIVKDMLLNIESIEIDGIDIGNLIWSKSKFIAKDSQNPNLDNCVNLGWNGAYTLKFSSPFYLWLLESM